VLVDWFDGYAYCRWAGGSLPSEAQWERAASVGAPGTPKLRYPWGDNYLPGMAQLSDVIADRVFDSQQSWAKWRDGWLEVDPTTWPTSRLAPPGRYAEGAAALGFLDMAGNAREWCLDFYEQNFYTRSPREDPVNSAPT